MYYHMISDLFAKQWHDQKENLCHKCVATKGMNENSTSLAIGERTIKFV